MAPLITPAMRIAFMGTPDFAVPTLDVLLAEPGLEVAAVYSQPPRPAGRGRAPRPSPVQARAEAAGLEVRTPVSLRDPEAQAAFRALDLDVAIVAAYGLILPPVILEAPWRGCLNVHASLLPRWRGAAPIQRAILAGDSQTGVTIMQMERGLDTGPMLAQWPVAIDRKTAGELGAEIAREGANLMLSVLRKLDQIRPRWQAEDRATYAPKIDKSEAKLDFSRSATEAERQIRAFNPDPGPWFVYAENRIKIHSAEVVEASGVPGTVLDEALTIACAQGALRPICVQRAGRAPMTPAELLRGFPIPPGARLG
ncbi:MAG: methionyl-tRNA formyltransferase [Sphingomonadales bacterium]|jgi:methionyl-tRNA formyltransferase|nr:methionyl-tRNA formyltransferase [Sphingomonadales bacterium]